VLPVEGLRRIPAVWRRGASSRRGAARGRGGLVADVDADADPGGGMPEVETGMVPSMPGFDGDADPQGRQLQSLAASALK
jgi:hypothetical protein